MTRYISRLIHQHLAVLLSDSDEELVDWPKVGLVLPSSWRGGTLTWMRQWLLFDRRAIHVSYSFWVPEFELTYSLHFVLSHRFWGVLREERRETSWSA